MLSDVDIINELETNKDLTIDRFDESCLTPVGYDLRAGETVFSLRKKKIINLDSSEIIIRPKETVFISSYETINLTNKIGGISISRLGPQLSNIICTALPIDPTWRGKLLIRLTNLGKNNFKVQYKERLITLCFFRMESGTDKAISRKRWDNENIKLKFREMEKDAIKIKNKKYLLDSCIIIITGVILFLSWKFGYIKDLSNILSLFIAVMAIYFSSIRNNF